MYGLQYTCIWPVMHLCVACNTPFSLAAVQVELPFLEPGPGEEAAGGAVAMEVEDGEGAGGEAGEEQVCMAACTVSV